MIKLENLSKQIENIKEETKHHDPARKPLKDIGNEIKSDKEIINQKLHISRALNVDDYFMKIRRRIQNQFTSKEPLFSADEMISMPAVEKMLSLKRRHEQICLKEDSESQIIPVDCSSEEGETNNKLKSKTRNQSDFSKLEKMLNFSHLYRGSLDHISKL